MKDTQKSENASLIKHGLSRPLIKRELRILYTYNTEQEIAEMIDCSGKTSEMKTLYHELLQEVVEEDRQWRLQQEQQKTAKGT